MVFRPANKTFPTDKASLETLCTTILRFPFDQISNIKLNLIGNDTKAHYSRKAVAIRKNRTHIPNIAGEQLSNVNSTPLSLPSCIFPCPFLHSWFFFLSSSAGRIVKRFLKIALLSWKQGRSVMKFRKEKLDKRLEEKRNDVNDRKGRIALNGGRVGLIEGGN